MDGWPNPNRTVKTTAVVVSSLKSVVTDVALTRNGLSAAQTLRNGHRLSEYYRLRCVSAVLSLFSHFVQEGYTTL